MVACDDDDADKGGIWGAYIVQVMNGRLLAFIFVTNAWWFLVTPFARLL